MKLVSLIVLLLLYSVVLVVEVVLHDYLLLFKQEILVDQVVVDQDLTLLKELDMLVVVLQTLHPIQVVQSTEMLVDQQYHYIQDLTPVVMHGVVLAVVVLAVLV